MRSLALLERMGNLLDEMGGLCDELKAVVDPVDAIVDLFLGDNEENNQSEEESIDDLYARAESELDYSGDDETFSDAGYGSSDDSMDDAIKKMDIHRCYIL
ncbi:hypothetical protein BSKO_10219 [Bryopsis sp. KO-2023]|nr:hypothetical protein BSKO_10219 [Bryopsis sp. KO-2023]